MVQDELNKILENHLKWLKHEDGGECADLSNANLCGVNLCGACLINANLCGACLSGADLSKANLRDANLYDADLRDANLYGADLSGTNLRQANLKFAYLDGVNLKDANLYGADLFAADLSKAVLTGANLKQANLSDSVLIGANLTGSYMDTANLSWAVLDKGEQYRLGMILTEPIKGYKKTAEGNIIELEIPEGAIVFSINNCECRANKATVTKCEGIQHSWFDPGFEYKEGNTINIKEFNLQYNMECAEGIHFFRTKEEAEKYTIVDFGI